MEARQRLAEFATIKRTAAELHAAAGHHAMQVPTQLHARALTVSGGSQLIKARRWSIDALGFTAYVWPQAR